ncbi:hypothetical protein ABBQ38_004723 [Trebouxia sp. C0009 RCD-2024]
MNEFACIYVFRPRLKPPHPDHAGSGQRSSAGTPAGFTTSLSSARLPAFTGSPWQQKFSSAGAQQNKVPPQTRDTDILNMFLRAPSASLHPTLPCQSAAATAQQVTTDVAYVYAQQDTTLPPATCRAVHPAIRAQKAKEPSGTVIENVALLVCSACDLM